MEIGSDDHLLGLAVYCIGCGQKLTSISSVRLETFPWK